MKKTSIHILFFLILEIVYLFFSLIYSREIEFWGSVFWNLALTFVLFCINLFKKRRNKWITIAVICAFHLYITAWGYKAQPLEGDIIYLLLVGAEGNIPFLPESLLRFCADHFESKIIRVSVLYFILFYGTLFYRYCVYRLSKKIVAYIPWMKPKKNDDEKN